MTTKRVGPNDIVDPVEKPSGMHETTTLTHPAFAQIHASRVSSSAGVVLYGSGFEHHHYVSITISQSELLRSLSNDHCHSGREMIEVMLSEAQWATFVSSVNGGGRNQCTLHWFNGSYVPGLPLRRQQSVAQSEADDKMAGLLVQLDNAISEVEGDIGRDLSKAKKDRILNPLRAVRDAIGASLPWIQQQFAEQMEETVERAKVEVHAYINNAINRAGLTALAKDEPLLRLGAGDASDQQTPGDHDG